MAIDVFISVAVDSGGAAPDKKRHQVIAGSLGGGDCGFYFDHLKIPDLNTYDGIQLAIRQRVIAGGLK